MLTVQQVIDELQKIENKDLPVGVYVELSEDGAPVQSIIIENKGEESATLYYKHLTLFEIEEDLDTIVMLVGAFGEVDEDEE